MLSNYQHQLFKVDTDSSDSTSLASTSRVDADRFFIFNFFKNADITTASMPNIDAVNLLVASTVVEVDCKFWMLFQFLLNLHTAYVKHRFKKSTLILTHFNH